MKAKAPSPEKTPLLGAGALAVGACAVCCAGPLLAMLGAIGLGSMVAGLFVPALLVLVPFAAASAWALRTRRARACAAPAATVDLGMPVVGGRADDF